MRVNLLTDAPKHNLALMRISAWHKAQGDTVTLNQPLESCDLSYGSWLFSQRYATDRVGGVAIGPERLPAEIQAMKPDYDLFDMKSSLGYTWEYCPRHCAFCKVPGMHAPKVHHSIWEFHNSRFKVITLLNNNTFSDPRWRETFQEIWDAGLTVHDENGYDARLLDEEKAAALKRTRFENQLTFAWDNMMDEPAILKGLHLAHDSGIHNAKVFVLMGYDTIFDQDLYRVEHIHALGFDPWPMLYKPTRQLRAFRRMIYLRYYRRFPTIGAAWQKYEKAPRPQQSELSLESQPIPLDKRKAFTLN